MYPPESFIKLSMENRLLVLQCNCIVLLSDTFSIDVMKNRPTKNVHENLLECIYTRHYEVFCD